MNKSGIGVIITSVILFSGILGFAFIIPDAFADPSTRMLICHIPPGNPANAHIIVVAENLIEDHEAHDDFIGETYEDTVAECVRLTQ